MKKVKSLKDLASLMEKLGATKDEEPGFRSWTLECGPGNNEKKQASRNTQAPQLKDKN